MTDSKHRGALSGLSVVELGPGAAAAYCGRLLADAGASVVSIDAGGVARDGSPAEQAFATWLGAGKTCGAAAALQQACREADLVLVGEDCETDPSGLDPRGAVVRLDWFGPDGAYKGWKGSDLVIQALTAMPHLVGPVEGPPIWAGDRHSSMVAGVTAYIAALSGVLAPRRRGPRRFDVSVLEANLVLSEMDIHFIERDGIPLKRHGINRFSPNGPVGIYPCREGWIGITCVTPDQWRALCAVLGLHKEAADATLATREARFHRLDEVEGAMSAALAARTDMEWAEIMRRHRVPGVVVPDAAGILTHPIFTARQSLATLATRAGPLKVPRTPFGLTRTPTAVQLDDPAPTAKAHPTPAGDAADGPPLAGLVVADFTMGWAGPLATRLLADLGADVLKIEAGRYPDWWRGVNWTPEYIETRQYEQAKGYCALNRGKHGISLDLTQPKGRALALALAGRAEAVIENQAAGVMDKLGLGYQALAARRPDIVMVSMSAFGSGNAWSDTRAYGSTLEQGSGLPSFTGLPGTPPTMAHLAYGDPVGGLYGCAALLTALVHKRRTGEGQYVNLSMIEAMLQFTAPGLLQHQVDPAQPRRRGNRHPVFAPHGIYPCAGHDRWVAIAIDDTPAFEALARAIGRRDWVGDASLATAAGRRRREDEIDAAIARWSRGREPHAAAALLQAAGVAAAPALHTEELVDNPHLNGAAFFIDLVRHHSGPQRQAGLAIRQGGQRLGARRPAPLLGEHSATMLDRHAEVSHDTFRELVDEGVVSFAPASLRSTLAQPKGGGRT
jgi:crotonobetainyl-CoA:carnitine CoA-transferase CaiB-like acyl-CoA transferase